MTALKYVCANWVPERIDCKEEDRYSCKNCRLVAVSLSGNLHVVFGNRICPNKYDCSTAVWHAKRLTGLTTSRNVDRLWVGRRDSPPGS